MANPPPKHGNPAKASQPRPIAAPEPPRTSPQPTAPETPRPFQKLGPSWRRLRAAGKYIALFSSFISGVILAIPKFSIDASVNTDPQDALATQFSVKNEGHVPAFNVAFVCTPHTNFMKDIGIVGHSPTWVMWPGQTMTRSCSIGAHEVSTDALVNVAVEYKWPTPWLGWTSTQSAHFSGRHGPAGYFLVPDLD
jgi:hypothetical protein